MSQNAWPRNAKSCLRSFFVVSMVEVNGIERPSACVAEALPTELNPHLRWRLLYTHHLHLGSPTPQNNAEALSQLFGTGIAFLAQETRDHCLYHVDGNRLTVLLLLSTIEAIHRRFSRAQDTIGADNVLLDR